MSLTIPQPKGSLSPFFTEIKRYLLNESNTENNNLDFLRPFIEAIDPETITMEALLLGLSQTGSPNDAAYKNQITEGLYHYLTQATSQGNTALILAACNSEKLRIFLNAMDYLSSAQQVEILNKRANDDWSALMVMARYHPESAHLILEAITRFRFSTEQQFELLRQIGNNGWNSLMLAADCNPEIIPSILHLMSELSREQQFEILNQTNQKGWNALMIAARYQPEKVPNILRAIARLSVTQQAKLLEHCHVSGWNILMILARYHPHLVPSVLKLMTRFSQKKQDRIFRQTNESHWSALSLSLYYQPDTAYRLFNAMSNPVKQLYFQEEDAQLFSFESPIIKNLFDSNQEGLVLKLLRENVISPGSKAFDQVVQNKKALLNYISRLTPIFTWEDSMQCLKEIHDNSPDSLLAKVFHTSRGILSPQTTRGVLGFALELYQKLQLTNGRSLTTDRANFTERLDRINFEGQIPRELICPISQDLMNNPVRFSDNHLYDKASIIEYIAFHKEQNTPLISPLTREPTVPEYSIDSNMNAEINTFVEEQERLHQLQSIEQTPAAATSSTHSFFTSQASTSNASNLPAFFDTRPLTPTPFFSQNKEQSDIQRLLELMPKVPTRPLPEIAEELVVCNSIFERASRGSGLAFCQDDSLRQKARPDPRCVLDECDATDERSGLRL